MKTLLYASIALIAGIVGFVVFRFGIEPRMASPAGDPAVNSPVAAAQPEQEPQHALELLPDFTLTDREGNARSIRSWPGKALVINFWATWCAPCRREIPLLKRLQDEYDQDNFQVVGIAVDFREDVLKYAEEIGINYPLLIGEQDGLDAISKFGISAAGFPFTVFTDVQSRIVLTHLGEIEEAEAGILLGVMKQVNAGSLTPEAARTVVAKQLEALSHAGDSG